MNPMKRQFATKRTQIVVECKQHDVDEPIYREYVSSDDVADAWITLHNLQQHGVRS